MHSCDLSGLPGVRSWSRSCSEDGNELGPLSHMLVHSTSTEGYDTLKVQNATLLYSKSCYTCLLLSLFADNDKRDGTYSATELCYREIIGTQTENMHTVRMTDAA